LEDFSKNRGGMASMASAECRILVLFSGLSQIETSTRRGGIRTQEEHNLVMGYQGNDEIAFDDLGAGTQIADVTVSSLDPLNIDVTSFIASLVSSNYRWAGFTLKVDYSSLPDRSTLSGDTTMGIRSYSANTDYGPTLEITEAAPVPEPSTILYQLRIKSYVYK
jgi:hypothetical protein